MTTYSLLVNGKQIQAELISREGSLVRFKVAGKDYEVQIAAPSPVGGAQHLASAAPVPTVSRASQQTANINAVTAPMPGIIVQVLVKKGDSVTPGQTVVIMEAMKMENNVGSPRAGKVKDVRIKAGDEVANQQELIVFEPA